MKAPYMYTIDDDLIEAMRARHAANLKDFTSSNGVTIDTENYFSVDLNRDDYRTTVKEMIIEVYNLRCNEAISMAATSRKCVFQRNEITRQAEQIRALKKEIDDMSATEKTGIIQQEIASLKATVRIQRKAIDDRQEWVNKLAMVLKESEGMI